MNTNAQLLSLVGDIYDTTFDRALWTATLQRIVEYTGSDSCGLVTKSATDEIQVTHHVGCKPPFVQTYLDHYGQFDPTHAIRLFDVGKIHSTEDWVPIDEFRKGRFYQEWAHPQRLEDAASVLLNNSDDGFSYFCVMKGGALVDDDFRRTLAPIVPHVLRAVLIGRVLHQQTRIASPIEHTLDELKSAMFLLDGIGNITHANESGRDILDRKDFLRTEQGRLVAADPLLNGILREAVAASILGDGATRSESIALPFVAQDGERFVGHLLPLTAGRRRKTGIRHHQEDLQADAGRSPRAARGRRIRRRVGDVQNPRHRRIHRQDASPPDLHQDRHQASDRPRQARRGLRPARQGLNRLSSIFIEKFRILPLAAYFQLRAGEASYAGLSAIRHRLGRDRRARTRA
jgi:hypothetical protein